MSEEETSSSGDAIECPCCGHVMRDLWDHDWSGGAETVDIECGECEEEIRLRRVVTVDYYARKISP